VLRNFGMPVSLVFRRLFLCLCFSKSFMFSSMHFIINLVLSIMMYLWFVVKLCVFHASPAYWVHSFDSPWNCSFCSGRFSIFLILISSTTRISSRSTTRNWVCLMKRRFVLLVNPYVTVEGCRFLSLNVECCSVIHNWDIFVERFVYILQVFR